MLTNSTQLLRRAKKARCAVPAINVYDLAGIKACMDAAARSGCPLMVSLAEVHLPSLDIDEAAHIVRWYAERAGQDIVLHFDHGLTPELVIKAVDSGFTSVMIDASSQSFEENVRLTREIVAYAHARNVSVEAEIGHVGGGESYADPENDDSMLTTVEEAHRFATETGVDSLAVSIGTAHGEYKGTPRLDFDRLTAIAAGVDAPLVLHGGSGSGDDNLRKAVQMGICKVNVFTDVANAARARAATGFAERAYYDSATLAIQGMTECILHYYSVFETAKLNGVPQ